MVRESAAQDAYTRTRARYRAHRRRTDRDRRPSLKRAVGWGLLIVAVALSGCLDPAESEEDCQHTMTAIPQQDGSVRLDWESMGENQTYSVQRKQGDGDYTFIGATNGTTFHDTTTEAHATYTYFVQDGEGDCALAEVTTVPFFGALTGALLAGVLVVGYAWARRRRK